MAEKVKKEGMKSVPTTLDQWFQTVKVRIRLVTDLVGGIPKNPEMIQGWLESKNREFTAEEKARLIEATKAEVPDLVDDKASKGWIGFKSDANGLYIEERQIKALLREAANVTGKVLNLAQAKSKLAERVFVNPVKIYLGKAAPDSVEERPIHVVTAQGARNALKRADHVAAGTEVEFELSILRGDREITPEYVNSLLLYGQLNGLGADRSQGNGRFQVVSFEPQG